MSTLLAERPSTHACERPSLESGDHLSGIEFHARYLKRPDIHKAELVNGVVYVASPTRTPDHGIPHNRLSTRLGVYAETHAGTRASTESTLRQESDDEVRPDVVLFFSRKAGGTAWLDSDHYLRGAPELVAEGAAEFHNDLLRVAVEQRPVLRPWALPHANHQSSSLRSGWRAEV